LCPDLCPLTLRRGRVCPRGCWLSDGLRKRGFSLGPWKVRPGGHWLQLADSRRTAGPAPRGTEVAPAVARSAESQDIHPPASGAEAPLLSVAPQIDFGGCWGPQRSLENVEFKSELHLATSIRSFRSENVPRHVKDARMAEVSEERLSGSVDAGSPGHGCCLAVRDRIQRGIVSTMPRRRWPFKATGDPGDLIRCWPDLRSIG
jgi:hypothetical protein